MSQTDPLQALNRELSITPTPEFAARVRRRIAAEPVRETSWSWLTSAAAAACVVAALAAVVQWSQQSSTDEVPQSVRVMPSSTPPQVTAPAVGSSQIERTAPLRRGDRRRTPVHAGLADTLAPFAEVLVPDDQRLALERLMASLRVHRSAVPEFVADDVVDDAGRRVPRALVIEPIRLPLLDGTPTETIKEPIKEPNK